MCIHKPQILIRECVDVPKYTWILSFNDRAVSMMGEVIRVSGRAPDVGDLLREAMVSQRFADVALCCSGGQRFLAHRLVLSAASPYLQDVFLAHGKAAGSSEPITIILAEVEGPELSAILGFVYTGSATIPKSRLEAFTRAAETLHVRIPKFGSPVRLDVGNYEILSSSCNRDVDCKFDCVKVEETARFKDARYLRCEQYPSWEGWLNPSDWHYHRECTKRVFQPEDWILRREENGTTLQRQREAEAASFSKDVEATSRKHLPRENFENSFCIERRFEKSVDGFETSRSGTEYSERRKSPWIEGDSSVSNPSSLFLDPSKSLPEIRKESENYEFPVQSHPGLEVFVAAPSKLVDSFSATGNYSSRTSLESCRLYEERIEENPRENGDFEPRTNLKFDNHHYEHSSSFSSKLPISPSLNLQFGTKILAETTVSSNIPLQFTTNLTNLTIPSKNSNFCSDNCCTWRTPKRHVANRVPASPWCQLARPAHHSPKTRPILPRNPNENVEASVHPDWNGAVAPNETRTRGFSPSRVTYVDNNQIGAGSLHANLEGNGSSEGTEAIYGFQVPKISRGFSPSVEECANYSKQPRSQEEKFYDEKSYEKSSTFPAPGNFSTEHFPARTIAHDRSIEKPSALVDILQDQSRPQQSNEASNIILNHEQARVRISQHAIPPQANPNKQIINDPSSCNLQTSPRLELSHPISRLCDSVRNIDDSISREQIFIDKDTPESSSLGIQPIEPKVEGSLDFRSKTNLSVARAIIQSDDNNNEPGISDPVPDISTNPDFRLNEDVHDNVTQDEATGNGEDHRCEQCGKTFVTRASLKVHGRTHSGEKPFRCTDCGKEFSQLRNYKYHRSVHEGTREFAATCPECGKYFNDRGYLSSHMKIHRNRKEYGCSECGKSFNQRVAYNMHVRIHTGVKPHQCDQCGKAFSRKMLLKQHLRTHSGERPYQCQICHKAFADRSNMTLHTRLHSGLKPYQCTLCSKAFTKKHHLKTHLNYHTGTKPYSCPNCSLRFSQSSNMRTHYKKCCSMAGIEGFDRHDPSTGNEQNNQGPGAQPTNSLLVASGVETPSVGGPTNALTPPNSDQESSIQTPTKINQAIALRSTCRPRKIDINVALDT